MKRSLRNHLARELMEGYSQSIDQMRFALDTAQMVLDFLAAHPELLTEWLMVDKAAVVVVGADG